MGNDLRFYQFPSKLHKTKAINLLEIFGISHLKDFKFNDLSGGQKQLVLFARDL
ncbi:MAG: hypothetical protein MR902_06430 [Campylobacter sp.]|nr:hypothetical protein [Campylobacter sp.]